MELSIVAPIYNEGENIEPLYEQLTEALEAEGLDYEVVAVDDGSKDDSFARLKAIHEKDSRWQVIQFRKNFGQTAGMSAGFDFARGDIIVTIDADLQNDPRDISRLLDKMHEGYDIVSGWRVDRKEALLSRRLPSVLANRLISRMTGVVLHDYGCTLKAYRQEVVKNLHLYGELHRFIPAVASNMGVKVTEIPVNDRPRIHGSSKYGISRTFRVILDLMTVTFLLKYFDRPLYMFGGTGLFVSGLGFLAGLYLAFVKIIQGQDIGNRPLLMLAVVLIVLGMQLISTGLVAEIVMRTYHEVQKKPTYFVRNHLISEPASDATEETSGVPV
jgi:glycosyltransferase involved in cell wall biosynthesis